MTQDVPRSRRSAVARLGLLTAAALAAQPYPAFAGVSHASLGCSVSSGRVELTNSSNTDIPRGADIAIVIASGTLRQSIGHRLSAALPIGGGTTVMGVLMVRQVGADTSCTATASWRSRGPFHG